MKRYLSGVVRRRPRALDSRMEVINAEVWKEVDCLTCANCCKTMSPTYTNQDIKRIATHLHMTVPAFKEKWLRIEDGDWVNTSLPCQFLDQATNMCTIYAVRPGDCAGFPHLTKKRMVEYMHVHQQNLMYCPATYRMVEKLKASLDAIQS